jgi:hypothetical protein
VGPGAHPAWIDGPAPLVMEDPNAGEHGEAPAG